MGLRREPGDHEKGLGEGVGCERVVHGKGLNSRGRGWAMIGTDRGVLAQLRLQERVAWAIHWAATLQHVATMVDEKACRAPQCNRVGC